MKKQAKRSGKGGRPPHRPSARDRRIVELAASHAVPTLKIAEIIGVDQKTLFKHYRPELDRAAAKLEAALAMNLYRLASCSDDSVALKAIMLILRCRYGWSAFLPPRG
ncbi:RNA polymerase subunit sigma-70 [Rhizobium sp. CC1099]|uniref:RNA polymerase subunit sigma-70 n=1 Tax=Rhizobium sp. CC1099 TaxID=3039160 RepID=UPI0024B1F44D|nr:RNA polymerase subunit sigma-70 [Rhizobium sp. CC1099]WFU88752.1 RNA polymerase subunit sigma-70 [Rhizobium sp. CC1099]